MRKQNTLASSASANRPVSRMSTATSTFRAASRLSMRTTTTARLRSTHVQKIAAQLRNLVQQVTGAGQEDDPDEFQEYVGGSLDTVLNSTGPACDLTTAIKRIAGHREKARINLHIDLADAFTLTYKQLNSLLASDERDPEDPVKRTNLPEILHLLLELSQAPESATHLYARDVLDEVKAPPPVPEDFWKTVLEEEPFEGEHWRDQWEDEDEDAKSLSSHPSLELESRESTSTTESTSEDAQRGENEHERERGEELVDPLGLEQQHVLNDAHSLYEDLCTRQYWRPGYINDAARKAGRTFQVNDPATLGPSLERALEKDTSLLVGGVRQVYIDEVDAVRDVLITIQGRESLVFKFHYDNAVFRRVEPASSLPRVSHLTITSYRSLLSNFASTATTLHHLRVFVAAVFQASMHTPSTSSEVEAISSFTASTSQQPSTTSFYNSLPPRPHSCRTLDAFAEAVDLRLRALDTFCAGLEEQICNARFGFGGGKDLEPVVVSLLSLQRRLVGFMARTFDVLYDLIRSLPAELPAQSYAHPRSYYPTGISAVTILSPLPLGEIYQIHPALLSKRLLDRLLVAVRACTRDGDLSGDPRLTLDNPIRPMSGASAHLMGVFIATVEPIWGAVGSWVKWGIDVAGDALDLAPGAEEHAGGNDLTHDREFFVRRRDTLDVASPDFWTAGYVLRTSTSEEDSDDEGEVAEAETKDEGPGYGGLEASRKALVPNCLMPVAAQVLAAGKAVGLLRAIGVWGELGDGYSSNNEGSEIQDGRYDEEDDAWPSFADVLKEAEEAGILDVSLEAGPAEDLSRYNLDDTIMPDSSFLVNQSSDLADAQATVGQEDYPLASNLATEVLLNDLPHILADRVSPRCQIAAFRLNRVLIEDCDLWGHLHSMEDLCFMRRGDVMTHFCDVLFARIEGQKPWSDYHILNSAFRDVLSATSTSWIDLGRVRLVYRGTKARSSARSMRAINGLEVEYEFPFPLPYMFGTTALDMYSQIFVLVLQLRRAKMVLDRILVRDVGAYRAELKMIYVLRGQLMWFINTYTNFVLTNVIHTQVTRFHKELAEVKSLDEMISKHRAHLVTLQEQCFLCTKDVAIHKNVLSILDMCIQFGDLFASVVADTTLDLSRPIIAGGGRRRRDRASRSNIVSFNPPPEIDTMSATSAEPSEPDVEETEEEGEGDTTEMGTTMEPTLLAAGDDWIERVERLSKGLDTLVRSLRRGVETLSGGTSTSAGAFGMLDFALEDWDL
ncbi:hypothetical protein BDV93DRAFT_606747 [Ceratobasidium sp. AG-I]|nr:hypothetical protein BDV93DRAFT_606747 [Ceratobasidium sp. AG-I]